jgi:hypothetical protein
VISCIGLLECQCVVFVVHDTVYHVNSKLTMYLGIYPVVKDTNTSVDMACIRIIDTGMLVFCFSVFFRTQYRPIYSTLHTEAT